MSAPPISCEEIIRSGKALNERDDEIARLRGLIKTAVRLLEVDDSDPDLMRDRLQAVRNALLGKSEVIR